jgi:cytochrome P450
LRRAITGGFTPRAIAHLEEKIQLFSAAAVDAVIEKGECDLHDVAAYTPIEIVGELANIRDFDRQRLYEWANAMFGSSDPELSSPMQNMMGAMSMFSYARRLGQERRANPGQDVFSLISSARIDGEELEDIDLGATFIVLATAGNETTRTQFMQGTLALIENPQAMADLRADLSLLPNAIEEMLRYTTPALCFGRKATKDVEVNGQLIKAGDQVIMWYCSGNRDESVFENPNQFDIRRANANKHLSFGANGGIHRCLGAMLARTELKAMLTQLITRMPDIQLTAPVRRLRSNFTNGIKQMPVRFTPGKALNDASHVKMYTTHESSAPMPAPEASTDTILQPVAGHDIKLVPLATVTLELGIPQVIQNGPRGTRLIVEVTKATWEGERFNATQKCGPSGDWALVDNSGALQVDVRATLETHDGATIFVRYEGRSDYMKAGQAPIVIAPLFETSDTRYSWLNKVQAIGRGRSKGMSTLVYDIYEVK